MAIAKLWLLHIILIKYFVFICILHFAVFLQFTSNFHYYICIFVAPVEYVYIYYKPNGKKWTKKQYSSMSRLKVLVFQPIGNNVWLQESWEERKLLEQTEMRKRDNKLNCVCILSRKLCQFKHLCQWVCILPLSRFNEKSKNAQNSPSFVGYLFVFFGALFIWF